MRESGATPERSKARPVPHRARRACLGAPRSGVRNWPCWLVMAALCLGAGGCTRSTFMDDDALGLSAHDYDDLSAPPHQPTTAAQAPELHAPGLPGVEPFSPLPDMTSSVPEIPPLFDVVNQPQPLILRNNPLVTVSVTEDIPLKSVLYEMGRQAGVDMEVDPRIEGGVVFSARQRPFLDVIERIASLTGLRYSVENDAVRVELDEPYLATYRLPNLSLSRSMDSETTINTGLSEGGGGQENSSEVTISIEGVDDFYTSLEETLRRILQSTQPRGLSPQGGIDTSFSLERRTGVVSVFGTSDQQDVIAAYFQELNRLLASQVLIEGRIIEVTLDEGANTGIDWDAVLDKASVGQFSINRPQVSATLGPLSTTPGDALTLSVDGQDANAILSLAQEFGTIRTLSSPRITVLNNQVALIKVAENFVYFRVETEREERQVGDQIVERVFFESTAETVPIGFVMAVQPSINLDTSEVTLTIRPTVTQISEFVPDPALSLNAEVLGSDQTAESLVPIVDVRELDSVLKMRSGEVAVLGGLMQQRAKLSRKGPPGTLNNRVLRGLLGGEGKESELVELVILLRATIVPSAQPDAADRRLYDKFVRDPRPVSF